MDFSNLIEGLGGYTIDGLTKGSIYALVALGYTLVYGVLRLINFAHGEVFMVGAWTVLGVYTALGADSGVGVPLAIGITLLAGLVAATATAGTALVIERVAYKPLRDKNAPRLIVLITAIGCSMVLMELFGHAFKVWFPGAQFGRAAVNIPTIIPTQEAFSIGGVGVSNIDLIVIVAGVAMMIVLDQFVNKSRLGRGVRAVAQDPDTASLMGVNKDRIIVLVFVIGGVAAGLAALLHTLKYDFAKFDMGFLIGMKAFTAAVLGGIGNLRGALVGGLLLGICEVYSSAVISSNWEDVTAFVILVVVLMFRPTGILGESLGKARA
ncbi:branched-chain amino acid ABC transporter permease [Myceligenerans crystallogenes]|uniref:Branched-chain amino acid ABC transporter permease n=1 Tax=Myceligenerans crystallogenes TaxID=316335 RepID=A0ABN2NCK4_9MICO